MERERKEYFLTDLYTVSSGLSKPAKDFGEGYPFVAFKDVMYNFFLPEELSQLVRSTDKERQKCSVKRGDVFLTRTSETMEDLGMSSVARRDYPDATFNGFTKRLRPHPDSPAYPEYVGYFLRTRQFRNEMMAFSTMSTRASLNNDMIGRLKISLPPLSEQRAAAHILGTLDDKIELNRRMNVTLEGMAQALFKSWFVDFDPVIDNALAAGNPIPAELADRAEVRRAALADGTANREAAKPFPAAFQQTEELGWIPEGWEIKAFGEVSICSDRKRIPLSKKQRSEKQPGTIPYYGATSVMDYIDEWIFDDIYLLIGEDGSVMHEDGSPFVQYIWRKSWVNNHAHVLQGTDGITTEHLMLFMQAQDVTPYVTGAVQLKINQKNMNSIPFVKATSEINESFAATIGPLYDRYKILVTESESLTKLRDTMLPKLISGELRIPDAEKLAEEALA